ncbi:unnamed protein product [Caenorhabditis auriculariae]|uniref:C4H2-type domain-containing protein n=1 Tax=Caenorhabditis auriculariae TaxID=2777116 RepID=A0A8S1HR42_9PELO|nr:unnamed protein product [Caenorhabditis auriculariae]
MDIQQLTSCLFAFVKTREQVDAITFTINEIKAETEALEAVEQYVLECNKTCEDLEMERKSHAEELRQINQDINQLEDSLKTMRSEREARRLHIVQCFEKVNLSRSHTNEAIKATNLEQELEDEEINIDGFSVDVTPCVPPAPGPFSNYSLFSFLQSEQVARPSQPETNKMKACESCNAQIHRNAPTCPMCKAKSRSKNPKRRRKAQAPNP